MARPDGALGLEDLLGGSLVASRYEIVARLGQGGMGVVFKAHDRVLSELVALKVLRREALESPEMAERFLAEIRLARAVSHRNVCRIHEYGEDRGLRFISMAYVDGEDLRSLLRREGALPAPRVYEIVLQVAMGLQAIHDEGIVHRDLKTANIMLDRRGVVRLMDFGIAKQWDAESALGLTAAGQIVGTPEYMSPEQIRSQRLDPRSDLYSLGVVIHELFTGRPPFQGETPIATLMRHLQEEPLLDPTLTPGLPRNIVPILRRALAKDPSQRYESVRELATALQRARGETTTIVEVNAPHAPTSAVRPFAPTERVAATEVPRRARRATAPAIAGAVVATIAVGATGLWLVAHGTRPAAVPSSSLGGPAQAPAAIASPSSLSATPAPPPVASASPPLSSAAPSPQTIPRRTAAPLQPLDGSPSAAPPPVTAGGADVESLLRLAEAAIDNGRLGVALDYYEDVLAREPDNVRARDGKTLVAEALATAHSMVVRKLIADQTTVSGTPAPPPAPRGFADGGPVPVRRVDQPPPPPGHIVFEAEPVVPRPGDALSVKVYLVNQSARPMVVSSLTLTTVVDEKRASGPVEPSSREAPPHSRTLLRTLAEQWKTDTTSWALGVEVRTSQGEVLQNTLRWR